jgi:hypothetical protein
MRLADGAASGGWRLSPECLEDWICEDNPVRVIDVFVGGLDLAGLRFRGVDPEATGRRRAARFVGIGTIRGPKRRQRASGARLPHERHEKGRDEKGEHDRSECVGEGGRHHRSPG